MVQMPGLVKKERAHQLNMSDESYETPLQLAALQCGRGELYDIIKKQLHIKLGSYII